jgi:O-antigen ligase
VIRRPIPLNYFHVDLAGLPDFGRLLLLCVMATCGAVTLPQLLKFGPVTGLALLSVGFCGAAWLLWLAKPWFPLDRWPILVPLLMFTVYGVGSMLWYPPTVKGLQVLAVMVGFFGLMLLTARTVEGRPRTARELHRVLDWGAIGASLFYAALVPAHGWGHDFILVARAFALFAMFGVARNLAAWRAGDAKGFWIAAAITGAIVISVSRTAMVAAMLMFPLAALSRFDRKGLLQAVGMAAAGVAVMAAVIFSSPAMYERFFGLDASMNVGGVAINASGRTQMWALLYADGADARWFGKGVGSSSILIDRYFPALGHPHNDYLRVLYDYGVVGLACFVAFLIGLTRVLVGAFFRLSAAGEAGRARLPYVLAPLLALVGVSAGMFTDNLMSYVFVMAPFGILTGCAIGVLPQAHLARAGRTRRAPAGASPARPGAPMRPRGRKAKEEAAGAAPPERLARGAA